MKFIDKVLKYAKSGGRVLDLGAGQGKQAEIFLDAGFDVTAVDKNSPNNINPKINWRQATVESFLKDANEKYDLIFAHQIFQFLDKKYATEDLPKIFKNILAPGGVVAVCTFYQGPEPAFDTPFASYYSLEELKQVFSDFEILHGDVWDGNRPDLKGQIRHFYISEIIGKI